MLLVDNVGATYAAGNTVGLQIVVDSINLILSLLIACALPENLICPVGLSLSNPEQLVSHLLSLFSLLLVWHETSGSARGVVTVCRVAHR